MASKTVDGSLETKMSTVHLELLRHGPTHNQLLSPAIQYLALVGNHAAAVVELPFKHHELLFRLDMLQDVKHLEISKEGCSAERRRVMLVRELSDQLGAVLEKIPGLIADLSDSEEGPDHMTHLQLVLPTAELALIPFELANAPGVTQPMVLQKERPVCVTRQARRFGNPILSWPRRPRILFAYAQPGKDVPHEAHRQHLLDAVRPWVHYYDPQDLEAKERRLAEHLVVLDNATLADIEEICSRQNFTHVHILAHGHKLKGADQNRFGLALHMPGKPDGIDLVDGERLAAALRTFKRFPEDGLSSPVAVSLAVCQGGQVGEVGTVGASVAHELQEAGIPLVMAWQFPLTSRGSMLMVEGLYSRLLWGEDPRTALAALRFQLRALVDYHHDWASLVVYATFPEDLQSQLQQARVEQARRAVDAALNHADALMDDPSNLVELEKGESAFSTVRERIEVARRHLQRLSQHTYRVPGLLAGAAKREAQVLWRAAGVCKEPSQALDYRQRSLEKLKDAVQHYQRVMEVDRSSTWAVAQYLSLTRYLPRLEAKLLAEQGREGEPQKWLNAAEELGLWVTAYVVTQGEIESRHRESRRLAWAHGTLAELYLHAALMHPELPLSDQDAEQLKPTKDATPRKPLDVINPEYAWDEADPLSVQLKRLRFPESLEEAERRALYRLRKMRRLAGNKRFTIFSHRRQLARYFEWFYPEPDGGWPEDEAHLGRAMAMAQRLVAALPDVRSSETSYVEDDEHEA